MLNEGYKIISENLDSNKEPTFQACNLYKRFLCFACQRLVVVAAILQISSFPHMIGFYYSVPLKVGVARDLLWKIQF